MSDISTYTVAQLEAELARQAGDEQAAAASTARAHLASGATGDVPPATPHPNDLAKLAIRDGLETGRSRAEALALGVAQILNAAIRGDTRANYTGRTDPGV